MNDCPSQDQLRCLLDEQFDPAELDELAIHLEVCVRGQDLLDTLTLSGAWKSSLRDLTAGAAHDDSAEASRLPVEGTDQSTCDVKNAKIAERAGTLDSPGAVRNQTNVEASDADPGRTATGSGSEDNSDLAWAGFNHPTKGGPTVISKDRQRGTVIGLAIGDALGAAVEFAPAGSFVEVSGFRAGGPHGLEPGEWTDDTSMALALADSIAEVGWDLVDQAER
jgi:hypothetical protein